MYNVLLSEEAEDEIVGMKEREQRAVLDYITNVLPSQNWTAFPKIKVDGRLYTSILIAPDIELVARELSPSEVASLPLENAPHQGDFGTLAVMAIVDPTIEDSDDE